jgi:hypothetical protein
MPKREVEGYIVVKHARYDKVDNKYDLTLNCQFVDKDRKVFVSDNLNFSKMNPEQNQKLLKLLGVDELNSFTPLFIKVFRPEDGKKIEEWEKLSEMEPEPSKKDEQKTLADEDKK